MLLLLYFSSWTAPATAGGPITFLAVGVVDLNNWYGQTNKISATLPDGNPVVPGTPGSAASLQLSTTASAVMLVLATLLAYFY